jgi:signal-transduction protein with cAMP-binding, CBS, and nucleotidyltransferase domain
MNWSEAMALLWAFELISERNADTREWARLLASFPLFADVGRRRLRKLVRSATFAEYVPGETVVAQDDADDALHVVLEGRARAIGGAAPHSLSVGDYFGELGLVETRSPYRIVATQPLYVMRLPGSSVGRLARQHPALAVTLLRDLAGRLALAANTRITAAPGCSGTGT